VVDDCVGARLRLEAAALGGGEMLLDQPPMRFLADAGLLHQLGECLNDSRGDLALGQKQFNLGVVVLRQFRPLTTAGRSGAWTGRVKRTTPAVTKTISSRPGNGALFCSMAGTNRAMASETAPRKPATALTTRAR
jgi:hypothetical protein